MKSAAFFLLLLAGSAAARTLNADAKPAGLLDPILGGGSGGGILGPILGGGGGGLTGGLVGGLVGGLLNGTLGGVLPGLLPGNLLNTTSGLVPIGALPIGSLIGGGAGGILGGLDITKTLGPLLGGILNGQLGGPITGPILNQTLGQILGPGINISLTVSVQGAPCTALLQQKVRKALGAFVTKTLVFVKVDTTKCTASNGVATVVLKVNVPLPDLKALGIDTSAVTNLLNSLLGQVSDLVNIRKNSKDIGKLLNFAKLKGFKITNISLQIGV